jgi:hypothetical protein
MHFMLSHRLKGNWSLWRRQDFHSTPSNYSSFAVAPHCSPIWYNLHSYIIYQRGRKYEKGLIFHSQVSIFGDSCQRGKSISPKQKDRTTTNFKNLVFQFVFKEVFQIGILCLVQFQIGITPFKKFIQNHLEH